VRLRPAPCKFRLSWETFGRRRALSYLRIGLSVICALFISVMIVLAFTDAFLSLDVSKMIGLLFVAAMLAFTPSLLAFLREIFCAVRSARDAIRQLPLLRSYTLGSFARHADREEDKESHNRSKRRELVRREPRGGRPQV